MIRSPPPATGLRHGSADARGQERRMAGGQIIRARMAPSALADRQQAEDNTAGVDTESTWKTPMVSLRAIMR
ncbi:hypothetical protein GCM10010094_90650 [Streptomyces flaveus]|uniref:Uncharacterized protein n=1 Tax=Streptomyces flaveus TaxID=66370 RepID=A0A917RMY7_9ACTN|nr:hypothetical protein GCM10010094_90650 [Streptomyces flaveus]